MTIITCICYFLLFLVSTLICEVGSFKSIQTISIGSRLNILTNSLNASPIEAPSVKDENILDVKNKKGLIKEMLAVGIPATAACLAEPLLSIVDTMFVGNLAISVNRGVIDLATMSINNAIFNILAAATAPLCTGTTNLVATEQGKVEKVMANPHQSHINPQSFQIFLNGLFVSICIGISINILAFFFGKRFIQNFFHPDQLVLESTIQYFNIRMISFPFTLMNYILVGFSLGTQNTIAPIVSICIAFVINVLGDYIFCKYFQLGIRGVAWATSLSSIIGTSVGLSLIFKSMRASFRNKNSVMNNNSNVSNNISLDSGRSSLFSSLNMPPVRNVMKSFMKSVDIHIIRQLFSTSLLILAGSLLNTMTYSTGAKISSSYKLPTNSITTTTTATTTTTKAIDNVLLTQQARTHHIAAHQVVMQMWWFLSYFCSPLAMIAESLLPKEVAAQNTEQSNLLTSMLLKSAALIAGITTCLVTYISYYHSNLFTSSVVIQKLAHSVTWQSAVSQFVIGITTALDGLFIGTGQLLPIYVQASLISTTMAWLYYTYAIREGVGLIGAWSGLVIFGVVRLIFYLSQWKKYMNVINNKSLLLVNCLNG